VLGLVGSAGTSVYTASKHAVEGLTKSAALEAAPYGIRVNAVAPGPVETPMLNRFVGGSDDVKNGFLQIVPLKRAANADEIAQTIVFLGSDKAPFITGKSIGVDGGLMSGI
jgi:NAD(P)-dependent dehydrogenase (short-subunit alcohol dehydrogenase family)